MKATPIDIESIQKTHQAIPLTHLLPDTNANKHFYKNGLSKLIPRLTIKVHSDLEKCYSLWDAFSPRTSLFDAWDMRYSFYQAFEHKPYFYTLYEGKKALGVMPLWFNRTEQRYEFFGGWWVEGNSFFVSDDHLVDFFLATLPTPMTLWSLRADQPFERMQVFGSVDLDNEPNFYKNIEGIQSIDSLLKEYKKKDRHHLKTDYLRMKNYGVRLEVIEQDKQEQLSVLETLFAMNIKRFASEKEKSVFEQEEYKTTFRQIVRNAGVYDVKFLVAKIQNHIAAVDMIITYNDIYYQFQGVNDTSRFNGIGNYMVYVELEDAINHRYKMIDCLQEDHTWKHRFFEKADRFIFSKDR